mmetsp:Transcript_20769/g.48204  ORF Transcript_20769/g.48204 Transcript_20769/m.48204 type:complete len:226 (+) Transcript_20769:101-778(+)|eukprot:CAMPEP_0178430810 /NCGR_PEP_ID=MMETSP0689_2-20121128/31514_1 /TAXON_ID=160604 /ORGANISM="Amphidinium massartii, Strain CS-259" /LENGTH=225 /DNA_ID=CAMNT_0020052683 /DNA_START=101 /DNA_END=778 /DNA_ORIENTATION=+
MAQVSEKEAGLQIFQMRQFILNEAKDKAEEITTKALEEFAIEKFKIVNATKEKIRQEYSRKLKQVETQGAIARSTAINRARLDKIKARQDVLAKIGDESKQALADELKDQGKYKEFITKLIVQGLLMLLESEVEVQCRASDDALVQSCFQAAQETYSKIISQSSGATKTVKLALDKETKLSPACLGGVVLACQKRTICIDNTIDSRLELVQEQAKPAIRSMLFSK